MAEEYTLINNLYGRIEKSFSNKSNINNLLRYIQRYADKNSNLLLSTNLADRLMFSASDERIIYTVTGISQQEVKYAISQANDINSFTQKALPFYILSILIMRYFAINKMDSELDAMSVYMSYRIYTSNHKHYFEYKPNKEIMDYTINNLSNRYLIKQLGTIQGIIEKTIVEPMHGILMEELIRCSDIDIINIRDKINTRFNSLIKNIANEFYENKKTGKYMFHEDEDLSEENFHLSDNISFKISRAVSIVSSSIIAEGFDQQTCIKRAINLNPGASAKKLEPMLRTIIEEDMKEISKMVSDILTLFIYKGNMNNINDIKTMKFISESLQIYKSNSQDEITVRIKERLLKWINMTSEKYGRNFISKGKTSLDTYRRSIYTCFVFKILECSK